jgi:hypothetical protein
MQPERRLKTDKRQGGLPLGIARPAFFAGSPAGISFKAKNPSFGLSSFSFELGLKQPLAAGPNQNAGFLACPTQTGGARAPRNKIWDW